MSTPDPYGGIPLVQDDPYGGEPLVEREPQQEAPQTSGLATQQYGEADLDAVENVLGELAAGANRTLMWVPDTSVKAVNQLLGTQIPTLSEGIEQLTGYRPGQGGYMEPGVARDAVSAAGEVLVPGAMGLAPVAGRNLAKPAQAAAEFAGMGSATPGAALPAVSEISPKLQAELALKNQTGDVAAAGMKLNNAGKATKDPVGQNALKAGVSEGVVGMVTGLNASTKQKMLRMVDILEQGRKNELDKSLHRPSDIVGDAIVDRVKVVDQARRSARARLSDVADGLEGRYVDFRPAVDDLLDSLRREGIDFDPKTGKVNFSGSSIQGKTAKKQQQLVREMLETFRDANSPPDAKQLHYIKRILDDKLQFGKDNADTTLNSRIAGIFGSFRHSIDEILDANFPEYDQVNTVLHETIGALDGLQQIAGNRIDMSGEGADAALGTLSRRLLSNAQSRVPLSNALAELDRVANRYNTPLGVQVGDSVVGGLDDNVTAQVAFVSELERLFGASAVNSFQGDIGKEVARGAADLATGNKADLARRTYDKTLGKLFSKTEEQQLQAIRELLAN